MPHLSKKFIQILIHPVDVERQHSVRQPCLQLNHSSHLEQFTNHRSNSTVFQHLLMTPENSSVLKQHCHRLTATIRAYDSNLFWHMARYKCWLLTYLDKPWSLPYLALPSGWAGCYTCPALRPYQFGPMRSPDVTSRSQWSAVKLKHRLWSRTNHQPPGTGDV